MSDETRIATYEGLFLFPQAALGRLRDTVDHLKGLLDRAEAEVISLGKWDERRLAYDIKGNKRGLYLISYFKAPTQKIEGLNRDCNLSDHILRAMILRADHVPVEIMEQYGSGQALEDEIALREAGDDGDAADNETADAAEEVAASDA